MGKKYILSFAPHVGTIAEAGALIKPKTDIIEIAEKLGFEQVIKLEELFYNFYNDPDYVTNKFQVFKRFKRKSTQMREKANNLKKLKSFLVSVTPEDSVFLQYPIYGTQSPDIFKLLMEELPKLKAKNKIILIHDLEGVEREIGNYVTLEEEKSFIHSFDNVILHNEKMVEFVREKTATSKFYELGIFDYIMKENRDLKNISPIKNSIFYAGTLNKSLFLTAVDKIPGYDFYAFGRRLEFENTCKNFIYKGVLNPVDVIHEGSKYAYGLVWNGDDIHSLTGVFGKYMEINNPYKFSCNVASGLPTITSSSAGIAKFITENNVGIVVDSLEDLNKLEISEEDYQVMRNNTLALREQIIQGKTTETILKQCLQG